jgi:hypothetical protein
MILGTIYSSTAKANVIDVPYLHCLLHFAAIRVFSPR